MASRGGGVFARAAAAAAIGLVLVASSMAASAQAPRIGLALSGGGARGLAHVGVLKVLEELRVPVHCVTGTSMGAIVGGTFASGMPIADMEKFVVEADWDDVFSDQPPRAEISMRRKADDYKTLFAPEYGVKDGGLVLPKGVVAGVAIEGFFRQLTSRATGLDDFQKLPIPFRAVAADIETGEAVVLARGSVSRAMRASMSVPGALAPVEIDGRLLVDGGIANNLPIDLARKLCADVVIAVNISTPALKRGEITSALSTAGQLDQLPRQGERGEPAEEPRQPRRAHRPRARRHLRRQLRARRRRDPGRRGGGAQACPMRSSATACRPSSTRRCAAPRPPRTSRSARWTRSASRACGARTRRCCAR